MSGRKKQEKDGFQGVKVDKASLPSLPAWEEREATTDMDKGLTGPLPWLPSKGEAYRYHHWSQKLSRGLFKKSLHISSMWGGKELHIRVWIKGTSTEN